MISCEILVSGTVRLAPKILQRFSEYLAGVIMKNRNTSLPFTLHSIFAACHKYQRTLYRRMRFCLELTSSQGLRWNLSSRWGLPKCQQRGEGSLVGNNGSGEYFHRCSERAGSGGLGGISAVDWSE